MAYTGTCQHMCPSKERSLRLGTNQMSLFERDESTMVKEYRRSGADQEEPSPEDLRTLQALRLTINYLASSIMDDFRSKSDESSLDWYDFLWDRLRAIRKDITQQKICDQESIAIVEKCARFHVHSCYSMNRVNNFDGHINKKNLNDCLQMLRQMYEDLQLKGIYCSGELEIQIYDVLLHLDHDYSSTNVLIRTSQHRSTSRMRFVTKIFNAFTSNDYCQFFRLMEKADYMESCILSLYANTIRLMGLKIIIASCATRQAVWYPVETMISSLGFDDINDLREFAFLYEMEIKERNSELFIILEKQQLTVIRQQDKVLPPFKSYRLVDSKMCGKTVGQLVYKDETDSAEKPELVTDASFTWFEDDVKMDQNDSAMTNLFQFRYDANEIFKKPIVPEVIKDTDGAYTCLVENQSNASSFFTQPFVRPGNKPKWTSHLEDVTVYVGQNLEFRLKSTSYPPIDSCQWFKGDELLIELDNSKSRTSNISERISMASEETQINGEQVIIFKLSIESLKLDDTGRFRCRINNQHGFDETNCFVKVLQEVIEEQEEIEEAIEDTTHLDRGDTSTREEEEETQAVEEVFAEPEIVTDLPVSVQAPPPKEIRLTVEASGSSIPVFSWRKDGLAIPDEEVRVFTETKSLSNTTTTTKSRKRSYQKLMSEEEEDEAKKEPLVNLSNDNERSLKRRYQDSRDNDHELFDPIDYLKSKIPRARSKEEIASMMPAGKFRTRFKQPVFQTPPKQESLTISDQQLTIRRKAKAQEKFMDSVREQVQDEVRANETLLQIISKLFSE